MEEKSENRWSNFKHHFRINRNLVTLKLVMFLYYGAATAFLPYTTVHMLQVGLTIEEVAIIYAVLPFTVFVGPPIAGFIADKIGNYKIVLMCSIAMCGIFHTMLILVDARGETITVLNDTDDATWLLVNSSGSYLGWPHCTNETCLPWDDQSLELSFTLTPSDCDIYCSNNDSSPVFQLMDRELSISVPFNHTLSWEAEATLVTNVDGCEAQLSHIYHENKEYDAVTSPECVLTCPVAWRSVCRGLNESEILNRTTLVTFDHAKHQIGFWSYFVTRIFASACLGVSFTMLDSTAVCLVKKHKGELGKQRAFAIVGSSITSPIAGFLVDWLSTSGGKPTYDITFYFADVLFFLTLLLVLMFEVETEKATGPMGKSIGQLIRFGDVDVYIVAMFFLGNMWGFLESYLFIYLIELSAPGYLLGLTVTVGSLIGVPFLYVADGAIRRVGEVNMLCIAFLTYSVRLIGYSLIRNPWLAMVFEAMEAVTIHLMGVASTSYNTKAAPPGLLATLNGLVGASHYSLGRGSGSFVGGTLMAFYGTRVTYQILGIASGAFAVIYFVLYRCIFVKLERRRLETRKNQETLQELMSKNDTAHHPMLSRAINEDALFARRMSS